MELLQGPSERGESRRSLVELLQGPSRRGEGRSLVEPLRGAAGRRR